MSTQGQQRIDRLDASAISGFGATRWEHDAFLDKEIPPSPEGKMGDRR